MTRSPAPQSLADRIGPRLLLIWAGLAIGVAFLATPAKFLAPSLSLPVALDVGRHTFRAYNHVELALVVFLLAIGVWPQARRRWFVALAVPGVVVVAQALWLIPALDLRVAAIMSGHQPPPSNLHVVYIAAEALKVVWLLGFGLAGGVTRQESDAARTEGSDRPPPPRPKPQFVQAQWKD